MLVESNLFFSAHVVLWLAKFIYSEKATFWYLLISKPKENFVAFLENLNFTIIQYQMKILDLGIRNQSSFHDDRIPFFSVWLSEQKFKKKNKNIFFSSKLTLYFCFFSTLMDLFNAAIAKPDFSSISPNLMETLSIWK